MSEALNDAITSSSAKRPRIPSPNLPSSSSSSIKIPDETRIGAPTLRVKDLDKMLSFYEGVFGLHPNHKAKERGSELEVVELGVKKGSSDTLLILKHDPNAKEPPHNFAGLFHFAVLVPDRKSLAHAFLALQKNKVQFDGFADHLVSESLYLHDPERNGIEIYRDKPISEWTYDSDGHVIMDTLPLDLAGILGELPQEDRRAEDPPDGAFPNGARIGHMHLRVTNLEKSVKFYTEIFGFHVSADWSSFGAMFLSAGKYHHHLGLNTWHSLGGKQHIDGEAGLDEFTIQLPRENGSSSSHYVQSLESQLRERSLTAEKIEDGRRELLVADPDAIPVRICCPTQQS